MTKCNWLAGALGLTLALGGCEKIESFQEVDSDGDGRISAEEARSSAYLVKAFEDMDRNRDGMLDREEYNAYGRVSRAPAPAPATAPPPSPRDQ